LAAAGTALSQIPEAIAEQGPQLIGTGITAGLGTLLGGPVGGLAGASAFITPQMAGSNIIAQATEQLERGEDLDIGVGKAFGTGLLQTAPELLGQYFIVGRGITGKLLGIDPQKLTTAAQRKAAADKLLAEAQRGFRRTAGAGVAKGAAGEASTEVFQQVLERAQAGQDLLSPEALASYGEAAYLGGMVGGALGPIGSFSDRSAARNRVQALKDAGIEEDKRGQQFARGEASQLSLVPEDTLFQGPPMPEGAESARTTSFRNRAGDIVNTPAPTPDIQDLIDLITDSREGAPPTSFRNRAGNVVEVPEATQQGIQLPAGAQSDLRQTDMFREDERQQQQQQRQQAAARKMPVPTDPQAAEIEAALPITFPDGTVARTVDEYRARIAQSRAESSARAKARSENEARIIAAAQAEEDQALDELRFPTQRAEAQKLADTRVGQRELFGAEEAPVPPAPPRKLTAEFLSSIGVPRNSALVRGSKTAPSIVGKDLTNPAQRDEVAATITQYLKNPAVTASGSNQGVNLARLLKSPVFTQAATEPTTQTAARQPQQLTIDDQIAATQEREDLTAAVQQRRQEQAQREAETQQAYQQREDERVGQAVAERIAQRPEGVPTAVGAAMQQAEARGRRVPGQPQLEIPTIPAADPTVQAIAAEERAIEAEAPAGTAEAGPAPVQGELIGPRGGPRTRMRPEPQAETEAQPEPQAETEAQPEGDAETTAESPAAKARREKAQAKAQENRRKAQAQETQRQDSIKAEAARKARSKTAKPADKNQQVFGAAEEILEADRVGDTKRVSKLIKDVDADSYYDVSYYVNFSKYGPDMDLPASAVVRTAASVDQEVFDLLKKNKLADALTQMAKMRNKSISRVASALAKVAGTTKVRFEAGLLNDRGEPIAGKYEPSTNTVVFNADFPPSNHVVLHEVMHAATAAELANPSSPYTKQLKKLFDDVKDRLDTAYGAESLAEFVAEAFSNPEFQAKLAQIDTKGDKISIWSRFKNIVNNIVRKLRGQPAKAVNSVRDEMDKIVMAMLAPAPESLGIADLYSAADTAANMGKDVLNVVGKFAKGEVTKEDIAEFNDYMPGLTSGVRKSILSVLPLNSIADYIAPTFPDISKEIKSLFRLIQQKNGARQAYLLKVRDTYTQLDKMFRAMPEAKRAQQRKLFNDIVLRSTMDRVDPTRKREYYSEYRFSYINEDGTDVRLDTPYKTADERNEAMAKLIKEKGWSKDAAAKRVRPYNPSAGVVEAYDLLKKELWNKMDPETQKAYTILRDAYAEAFVGLRKTLLKRIESVKADEDVKQTYKDKILYELLNKESIEPYFPLYRKGDYWLTYTAKDELTGQPAVYKEAFVTQEERARARRDLEQDPSVDKKSLADAMRPKDARGARSEQVDPQFVYNLLGAVNQKGDDAVKAAGKKAKDAGEDAGAAESAARRGVNELQGIVMGALLDAMPERSLFRAFKRRQNVRGAQEDALTVFKERMPAFLGQTTNLEYDFPFSRAKADLSKLAGKYAGTANADYAREITDHVSEYVDFAKAPALASWARGLKSAGFAMTLGANLSSALVNLFILPTVVLPYLAGKHGWSETFKAMNKARKLYMQTGMRRALTTFEGAEQGTSLDGPSFTNVDFSDPSKVPEGFKKFGDEETRRNKVFVDVLNNQGLAQASTVSDMLDLDNPINSTWDRVNSAMGFMFHQGERFARHVTMKAAYDLILDKKAKGGKTLTDQDYFDAAQEAVLEAEHTNSGALLETAPKIAQNNVGSILLMYKRFGISMLYLQFKMLRDILNKGSSEADKNVRKQAWKQAIGIQAMSGIFAGVQGMPIYGAIGMLAPLFLDDEDEDFDSIAASFFSEGMYSGIVNATGLDISPRIGLSNLLYRSQPNVEQDSAVLGLLEKLGGPVVGIGMRILDDAVPLIMEGEVYRGMEKMVPAFISAPMKAVRYAREGGATTMRDDVIFDDMGPLTLGGQFFGFAPAGYTKQLEVNSRDKRIDRVLNEKRTKLLRQRYLAIREGDYDEVSNVDAEIDAYNERNPDIAITPEVKENSRRQHKVTDEVTRMFRGITVSPRLQERFIRRRLEDTDEGEFFQ
jgi:hypothetical protein